MITIHPARQRSRDRVPSETDKRPAAQIAGFPAPVRGLVTNQNYSQQGIDTATVLDNFWPTSTGISPRGGYKPRVDVAGDVTALFEYRAGDEFIVTDATSIYTFTALTSPGTTLTAEVSSLTSGDWQGTETQNDAGSFFTMVNGSDNLQLYDGTTWYTVTDVSATHSITGSGLSGTDAFTYVANYRERQWFVEGGTMKAWYLGVNSISGTATKFPLAGVFSQGGSLHSITTFSSDAGDGLDDRIVFLTNNGEFALYEGDPSGTMSLIGVYEIGLPIARMPFIRIAGDAMVCTKSGLIPISAAIQKDPSQLKTSSVSRPIERDWEFWHSTQPSGWHVVKWASRNMAIVAVPVSSESFIYVINLETGAWARFTGWNVDTIAVLGDSLHFADGVNVYEADVGGQDNGSPFVCAMCSSFQSLGGPGAKTAKRVRGNFRSTTSFIPQFSVAVDYTSQFPTAPNATTASIITGSEWDAADWDIAEWGAYENDRTGSSQWHVVNGHGFALAVQLQITSSSSLSIDCDLVSYDLAFMPGDT